MAPRPGDEATTARLDQLREHLKGDTEPERAPLRTIFPPLEIEEHPIDEYPSIKVIVVGAGPAGVTAGALFTQKVPGIDLTIYERYSNVVIVLLLDLHTKSLINSSREECGRPIFIQA